MRIPYDSLTLAAVVDELQAFVGGRVQRISQPEEATVTLSLYVQGREGVLLLSCHAEYARAHLITRRPKNAPTPPQFLSALRARLENGRLAFVRQVGFDRILELGVEGAEGPHIVVAELMGKHSNLMLVDEHAKLVGAAKWVGPRRSSRPILPGREYVRPPLDPRPSLLDAKEGDDLRACEGASPFLVRLIEAMGPGALAEVQARVREGRFAPFFVPGSGAYAIDPSPLGLVGHARTSVSVAVEQHVEVAAPAAAAAQAKTTLLARLRRVLLARDTALSDLRQAEAQGGRAREWQTKGELILAYLHAIGPGAKALQAYDYEGNPIEIPLDPDLDGPANANRLFEKAKKAKGRLGTLREQIERIEADRAQLEALSRRVEEAARPEEVADLQAEAEKRRWLLPPPVAKEKEQRPYAGHRIRELMGPGGWMVLHGENAESNDYLTLRVAKPNDLWVHIRGGISAHVVIPTRNQPDRVPREVLLYAAKVAVQNSPSKHSGYVAVDYTLKKYVRRPHGAPKGTVLYTHEKTLHVEG